MSNELKPEKMNREEAIDYMLANRCSWIIRENDPDGFFCVSDDGTFYLSENGLDYCEVGLAFASFMKCKTFIKNPSCEAKEVEVNGKTYILRLKMDDNEA